MSRQPSIRWSENDNKELTRIAKNYNAKLKRERDKLISKGKVFQASNLPKKASVKEMKESFETRKDYRNAVAQMQNYIKTGDRFILDKNTKKSLQATVRDFNKQIDKLSAKAKTQGEKASLPEKITIQQLIDQATSKAKLKRDISDYKRFYKDKQSQKLVSIPDTKHNIRVTKWQLDLFEERKKEIDARREEQKQKYLESEVLAHGRKAGYKQKDVREELEDYKPLNLFTWSTRYSDIREKMRLIMRESNEDYYNARTELARINYLEKVDKILGDSELGKKLKRKITSLSTDDFYIILSGEDDLFDIFYVKDHHTDEKDTFQRDIFKQWFPDEDYDDYLMQLADRTE